MKIQIITENNIKKSKNIIINSFASLESLDAYDINIFDLNDNFWRHNYDNTVTVNLSKDIKHIKNIIMTANNKKIYLFYHKIVSFIMITEVSFIMDQKIIKKKKI